MSQRPLRWAQGTRNSRLTRERSSLKTNVDNPEKRQRSKSKHDIPKNVRYELENALVGLCDVWFEEIKPHLVRNKIKLHVHGGDTAAAAPESPGDCSHLDPGAHSHRLQRASVNCANCYSMPPTASKAPCRKPPLSHQTTTSKIPNIPTQKEKPKRNNRRKGRPRQHQNTQPKQMFIVPRLCRTAPDFACNVRKKQQPNLCSYVGQADYATCTQMMPKSKINKTKWTQTDVASDKKTYQNLSPSLATTSLLPTRLNNRKQISKEVPSLFECDLIDIIKENYDNRLQLLYRSQQIEESPSTMNLLQLSNKQHRDITTTRKVLPWK